MNASWQDAAVICAALVALVYVAKKVWRRLFSSSPRCCDTCRRCPVEPKTEKLVTLDAPRTGADD
jgi:hypothetical protein